MVDARRVVGREAAVEADTDADAAPGQGDRPSLGQECCVGLHDGVDGAADRDAASYEVGEADQGLGTREQRFTAVQDQ